MNARITSVAETLRVRIRRASVRAGVKQRSVKRWSHQDDVELLLSVARLHLHRYALADEAGEHFERRRFLFQEAVDYRLRGEDAEFARLVEGARLAQDLVAHGVCGLHLAAAAAGRAGLAQDVGERLARALARHLDQAESGEAVHRDARAVARHGERLHR